MASAQDAIDWIDFEVNGDNLGGLTKQLRAEGANVINFGAGEPDFATPDFIVDAMAASARSGVRFWLQATTSMPKARP